MKKNIIQRVFRFTAIHAAALAISFVLMFSMNLLIGVSNWAMTSVALTILFACVYMLADDGDQIDRIVDFSLQKFKQ